MPQFKSPSLTLITRNQTKLRKEFAFSICALQVENLHKCNEGYFNFQQEEKKKPTTTIL